MKWLYAHRVELIWPRTQPPCPVRLSVAVKLISYRGIEAENTLFQPSAWGFLTTKHSRRFASDVTLALREKIATGMDFRVANRLWADNGRTLSVQPWLRLRTLKTRTSRNCKINSKRHKNTPEVSHFHSFYWMKVNWAFFRLYNRRYFISHTKSYNAFKFSTAVCSDASLGCLWCRKARENA